MAGRRNNARAAYGRVVNSGPSPRARPARRREGAKVTKYEKQQCNSTTTVRYNYTARVEIAGPYDRREDARDAGSAYERRALVIALDRDPLGDNHVSSNRTILRFPRER